MATSSTADIWDALVGEAAAESPLWADSALPDAEQQRRVGVGGREQTRPAEVEEVTLVDRLDAECEALLAERREDGLGLALGGRP